MLPIRSDPHDKTEGILLSGGEVVHDGEFAAEADGRLRSRQIRAGNRPAAGAGLKPPIGQATVMDHVEARGSSLMIIYHVGWGRGAGTAQVSTAAELDAVLDSIVVAPQGLPYSVSIVAPDGPDFPPMLEICVGHPERSFLYHVGDDGGRAWAYQPDLPPGSEFLFDYGGVATDAWPERTRVTPSAARDAARRFIASGGKRPRNLSWDVLG